MGLSRRGECEARSWTRIEWTDSVRVANEKRTSIMRARPAVRKRSY